MMAAANEDDPEYIKTSGAVAGFIVRGPELDWSNTGQARLYLRFGIERSAANDDGTFTELEPSYHNLVMWGASAERAGEAGYRPGDHFIATGRINEYTRTVDGQQVAAKEFIANHIGPDGNLHTFQIDRANARGSAPVAGMDSVSPRNMAAQQVADRAARLGGPDTVTVPPAEAPYLELPF
jgi:single-strand DNA-binding protein